MSMDTNILGMKFYPSDRDPGCTFELGLGLGLVLKFCILCQSEARKLAIWLALSNIDNQRTDWLRSRQPGLQSRGM